MAAAAVVLAVVFALGAVWLATSSSKTSAVIGLARDVSWGQAISAADLVEVQAARDPALAPLPWSQAPEVVGRRAAVDLVAGGLLVAADLTDVTSPGPGQALVGVAVKTGQIPATGLNPGDRVLLVTSPDPSAPGATAPESVDATVLTVSGADQSGGRTVDVLVGESAAASVAVDAAAGRLSIVLLPRG